MREAMKGWGVDKVGVIGLLIHRTREERWQIKHLYEQMYRRDLVRADAGIPMKVVSSSNADCFDAQPSPRKSVRGDHRLSAVRRHAQSIYVENDLLCPLLKAARQFSLLSLSVQPTP